MDMAKVLSGISTQYMNRGRSKEIVEPIIKPQWYVKCGDMAVEVSQYIS